jgi:hypothetical protein
MRKFNSTLGCIFSLHLENIFPIVKKINKKVSMDILTIYVGSYGMGTRNT